MRRAGTVVEVAQGVLVCRMADEDVDLGAMILDDSLTEVGRVVDVFGPVTEPFAAISPSDDVHPPRLVGEHVYVR
ncbi:H/ACA ribonucleoprotein complex subunit GAR1 [Halovivax cerinus]|uniref:H/ACA ribonucleoprotein complex subunit GAR1 n=1 Tax=Halovivax cerinus TaxID=1487865 RepID=A0ABD5NSF4_9EURY|nr:Gar1/Naf1 family protein [Halovivax cerinus]